MCMVSMVYVTGQQMWPNPGILQGPVIGWAEYNELVRKAAEFDRITNQPDCHDPAKEKWYKAMEERVRKLEESRK